MPTHDNPIYPSTHVVAHKTAHPPVGGLETSLIPPDEDRYGSFIPKTQHTYEWTKCFFSATSVGDAYAPESSVFKPSGQVIATLMYTENCEIH